MKAVVYKTRCCELEFGKVDESSRESRRGFHRGYAQARIVYLVTGLEFNNSHAEPRHFGMLQDIVDALKPAPVAVAMQ